MDTAILGRPLSGGLDLRDLLETVARHYLERAMKEAGGNKSQAKDLVGLPSPQTLTNWLKRYGLESP
jgi:DNA-binding NtrC family response regulator